MRKPTHLKHLLISSRKGRVLSWPRQIRVATQYIKGVEFINRVNNEEGD